MLLAYMNRLFCYSRKPIFNKNLRYYNYVSLPHFSSQLPNEILRNSILKLIKTPELLILIILLLHQLNRHNIYILSL